SSRCWGARARAEPFCRDRIRVGPPTRPKRAPQRAWNPQALRPGRTKRLRIALLSFDHDSRNHELGEIRTAYCHAHHAKFKNFADCGDVIIENYFEPNCDDKTASSDEIRRHVCG